MDRSETEYRWTPAEITRRIGMSTVVFSRTSPLGHRELEQIRDSGIVRVEICGHGPRRHYDYDNAREIDRIRRSCGDLGISIVSVHGPKVPYTCEYEEVRQGAVREGVSAARVAEDLGASVFVGHFGTDEHAEKSVIDMLKALDGSSIRLAIENGTDVADFVAFADRIGSERFGVAVDVGHARNEDGINPFTLQSIARSYLAQCGSRLFHVHLHDFMDRDHYAPLTGDIQWDQVFAAFADIDYQGEIMFEAAFPTVEAVIAKTAAFPVDFVDRYYR